MSVNPLTPYVNPGASLLTKMADALPHFPKDVWVLILSLITNDQTSYRHITSAAAVCRFFLHRCLQSCVRYRTTFILKNLSNSPKHSPTLTSAGTLPGKLIQLAIGPDGKKYFCRYSKEASYLFFQDFREGSFNLKLLSLNSQKLPEENKNFSNQTIVNCHPLENGFILVTDRSITLWSFKNHEPIFQKNIFCFQYPKIQSSAYKDPCLFVRLMHNVVRFDLKSFEYLPLEDKEPPSDFSSSGNCIFVENRNFKLITFHEMELTDQKKLLPKNVSFQIPNKPFPFKALQSDKWLLLYHEVGQTIYVFNLEKKTLWLDGALSIKPPMTILNQSCFLNGDFLFVKYGNGDPFEFKAIHLPTKKDYSEKLKPFLKPCFGTSQYLVSIEFFINPQTGCELHLLLEEKSKVKGEGYALSTVVIPLESFEPALLPSKKTKEKVMLVAGIILLLATIALFTAFRVLQVRAILSQNQFGTLTLPAVLAMTIGAPLSLIIMAISAKKLGVRPICRKRPCSLS